MDQGKLYFVVHNPQYNCDSGQLHCYLSFRTLAHFPPADTYSSCANVEDVSYSISAVQHL